MNVSPAGVVDQCELQQGAEHEPLHSDHISTAQYSTVQYSKVQYSTGRAGIPGAPNTDSCNVKQVADLDGAPARARGSAHHLELLRRDRGEDVAQGGLPGAWTQGTFARVETLDLLLDPPWQL